MQPKHLGEEAVVNKLLTSYIVVETNWLTKHSTVDCCSLNRVSLLTTASPPNVFVETECLGEAIAPSSPRANVKTAPVMQTTDLFIFIGMVFNVIIV